MQKTDKNNNNLMNIDIVNYYIKSNEALSQASDDAKIQTLKRKLEKLNSIENIDEAKKYVAAFLSVKNDKNFFSVGNVRGIVLKDKNIFRVILDSEDEYICYNYVKKEIVNE